MRNQITLTGVAPAHAPLQSRGPIRPSWLHASCVHVQPSEMLVKLGSSEAVVSAGCARRQGALRRAVVAVGFVRAI